MLEVPIHKVQCIVVLFVITSNHETSMTLVQLRHFIALAELGSFARASKNLFITQPALSRSIQALEDELGEPVFDRLGRRIELTTMGQMLLPRAKNLVQEADSLKTLGKRMQEGLTGTVRVGLGSGPGAILSVPMLLHMAQHHPKLHFEVSRGNTELLIHALRMRKIDAAVVDIRALRPAADLCVSHKVEMAASFMCRKGHPISKHPGPIPFKKLLAYPIASTPLSDEVARMLTECYGAAANPDHMVTLRCDDTQTLVELAKHCDAVVLTINAVGDHLVRLKIDPPMRSTARFGLVTLDQRSEVPGLSIVKELVVQLLSGLSCNDAK
jgi:DNA-binding transcriptional LysR family regulator